MSTSLGRALRTVLTLACALAALAVVAGPAMASELLEETGEPPVLTVLGSTYNTVTNEFTIPLGGTLEATLEIGGSGFEPFAAGFPVDQQRFFCTFPEFAGIYAVIGLLTEPWRPSQAADPDNRVAGLSTWANENAAATVPGRSGCAPGTTFPGQTVLSEEGDLLFRTTVGFCREAGGNHVLTGSAIGAGGRPVTYLVPLTNGVWHLYTLGAFGAVQESNEEVVNLRFTGFPRESAACPAL